METKFTVGELESEIARLQYIKRRNRVLRSTVSTLLVVAAICVLIATIIVPVFRIYGSSMTPTLYENDIVFSLRSTEIDSGDLVAFYFGNKILVKRVIAGPGDWVDIQDNGDVFVNGTKLLEPYLTNKALGNCNIELPYQVPEDRYFLMGDHRSTSEDSRSRTIGCVAEEQIIGKIAFRVWPLSSFGWVK